MWKLPTPLAGAVSSDGYTVLSYTTKAIILDPFGGKIAEVKEENPDYTIKDVGIVQASLGYFVLVKRSPEFEELFGSRISVYTLDSKDFTELTTIVTDGFNYHGDCSYLAVWGSHRLYMFHESEGLVWTKRKYGRILGVHVKSIFSGRTSIFGVVSDRHIALLDEEGEPIWKMKKPKFVEEVNGVITTDDGEIGVAYTTSKGKSFIALFADGEELGRLEFPFGRVLDFKGDFALGEFGFARWYYPDIPNFEDMSENLAKKCLENLEVKIPTPRASEGKILTGHYLLLKTKNGYELFYPYAQKTLWKRKVLKAIGNGIFILTMGPTAELLSLPEAVYGKVKVPIPPYEMAVSDYGKVAIVYKFLRGFLFQVFLRDGKKILERKYNGDFKGIKFCGDEPVVFWGRGFKSYAEFRGKVIEIGWALRSDDIFDCSMDGRTVVFLKDDIVSVVIDGELKWAREIEGASEVFVSGDGKVIYARTGDSIIAFSREGKRLFRHEVPAEATNTMTLKNGIVFQLSLQEGVIVTKDSIKPFDLSIFPPEVLDTLTKYGFGFEYDRLGLLVEKKSRYKVYNLNSGETYLIPEKGECIYGPVLSPSGRYFAYVNEDYDIEVLEVIEDQKELKT